MDTAAPYIAKPGHGVYFTFPGDAKETFGIVKDIHPNSGGIYPHVRSRHGGIYQPFLAHGTYRRETLREYRRRPTSFGKTPWAAFYLIQVMLLGVVTAGFLSRNWIVAVAMVLFAGLVEWLLFYMTKRNYLGKTN